MTEGKHVFIIGSKGIPAQYGGFETFVEELVRRRQSEKICYHVACATDKWKRGEVHTFSCHGVECFEIPRWPIGAGKAVLYDVDALRYCVRYIREKKIQNAVVYVLACRIGLFIGYFKRQIQALGGKLLVNPDGHEWERAKWNSLIKEYWKFSEARMVRRADLVICDSKNIEAYIEEHYRRYRPKTVFIPYGADIRREEKDGDGVMDRAEKWFQKWKLKPGEYYLIVGRFVPENNYETILREFMASKTKKKLAVITNMRDDAFCTNLKNQTHFEEDKRICFTGTVYDPELLAVIRRQAFAYLHGHEVGGTNPSLLEAMGMTKLNLLYDVCFNREVGQDAVFYWTKEKGSLRRLIASAEKLSEQEIQEKGEQAKKTIEERYQWSDVVKEYEEIFLNSEAWKTCGK
ncbi:MAG: DUF1972 domain-containing protein [Eubacteriales bacterium]|nr:DUF1972 domain-containing protein [Eubacteriales bacterium]